MFHPLLKKKFEYFTNYFETALKNKKRSFAQSIVLYGQDIIAQYYLALDIARQLNCLNFEQNSSSDCTCINCGWIHNNQHPAVMTITKNDNKPSDDMSNKVISIKQALMVNNSLINSSEYYRVFIFCDSELNEPSSFEKKHIDSFSSLKFKFPQENWLPKPLTRDVLIEASANALLKSIEEPPEKTLFIFLAEDKEDIIETIISRSQCFYVPSYKEIEYDKEFAKNILDSYPIIDRKDVISIVSKLLVLAEEKGYNSDYVLDCIEAYFVEMIKQNIDHKLLVQKIQKDILKIQEAKKQSKAYIRESLVFENLFFEFC